MPPHNVESTVLMGAVWCSNSSNVEIYKTFFTNQINQSEESEFLVRLVNRKNVYLRKQ